MTLPASGPISLSNVNSELGRNSPYQQTLSLGDAETRTLFDVASGAISMSNGYGKYSTYSFNLSASGSTVDLRTAALAAGWNGNAYVIATLPAATSIIVTSGDALTISGSFPNGVRLNNRGTITGFTGTNGTAGAHGARGVGGNGGLAGNQPNTAYGAQDGSAGGAAGSATNGTDGGTAISASVAVSIDNLSGVINGGVGGASALAGTRSGGGGGGGSGRTVGIGGKPMQYAYLTGGSGGYGYSVATGAATSGGVGQNYGNAYAGSGGNGGDSAVAGSNGGSGDYGGGAGGAAGAAGADSAAGQQGNYISGNANVTWINNGTRAGNVV